MPGLPEAGSANDSDDSTSARYSHHPTEPADRSCKEEAKLHHAVQEWPSWAGSLQAGGAHSPIAT